MNPADPLAALAPLRTPPPVPPWPPAPGWWLLAGVALAAITTLAVLLWRRHRRGAALRAARRELAALRTAQELPPAILAQQVNALLKRIAQQRFPRRDTAALAGRPWINFLNGTGEGAAFKPESAELPYTPDPSAEAVSEFCAAAERWLHARRRRSAAP